MHAVQKTYFFAPEEMFLVLAVLNHEQKRVFSQPSVYKGLILSKLNIVYIKCYLHHCIIAKI